jgi:hypothetical protein
VGIRYKVQLVNVAERKKSLFYLKIVRRTRTVWTKFRVRLNLKQAGKLVQTNNPAACIIIRNVTELAHIIETEMIISKNNI